MDPVPQSWPTQSLIGSSLYLDLQSVKLMSCWKSSTRNLSTLVAGIVCKDFGYQSTRQWLILYILTVGVAERKLSMQTFFKLHDND